MLYTREQTSQFGEQTFAYLEVQEAQNILTITLNRPQKKNALNPVMVNELAYALAYANHQANIWSVVLAANGNVFCAGADLKAFMGAKEANDSTIPAPNGEVLIGEIFNKLHKPCIAKVEGDVYAGGFLLLCGCTHVVAVEGLKLGLPEVKRGLYPFQVMAGLLEVMPARKVIDWCVRGYNLSVEKALEYGLVTHLESRENIAQVITDLVTEIKANSPTAIRMGLEAYDHIRTNSTEAQHTYLRNMLLKTVQTKDAQEGIQAFKEKRSPKWLGE